jgi:hypothetical protein
MKTPEDEAFEDIERKQGGGFPAKRAMAADRFKDGIEWWMDTTTYGAYPNPPQWHIDTGKLVRLVPAQPAQEPVAWITPDGEGFRIRFSAPTNDVPLGWDALYTAPTKREWVGLTDEEIAECFKVTPDQYLTWHIYKRIEAKLKEKNT